MKRGLLFTIIYAVLIAVGIPWYWPQQSTLSVFGIPAWVMVAIATALTASVVTAFLLIRYPWQTEDDLDE